MGRAPVVRALMANPWWWRSWGSDALYASAEAMGFVGLVPSLDASGLRHRTGPITKTGNAHVRRVLVERGPTDIAAWNCNGDFRDNHLRCRSVRCVATALEGARHAEVVVAIARELVGFLWATARAVDNNRRLTEVQLTGSWALEDSGSSRPRNRTLEGLLCAASRRYARRQSEAAPPRRDDRW